MRILNPGAGILLRNGLPGEWVMIRDNKDNKIIMIIRDVFYGIKPEWQKSKKEVSYGRDYSFE